MGTVAGGKCTPKLICCVIKKRGWLESSSSVLLLMVLPMMDDGTTVNYPAGSDWFILLVCIWVKSSKCGAISRHSRVSTMPDDECTDLRKSRNGESSQRFSAMQQQLLCAAIHFSTGTSGMIQTCSTAWRATRCFGSLLKCPTKTTRLT